MVNTNISQLQQFVCKVYLFFNMYFYFQTHLINWSQMLSMHTHNHDCGHFYRRQVTAISEWIQGKFRWVTLLLKTLVANNITIHSLDFRRMTHQFCCDRKCQTQKDRDWTLTMSESSSVSKLSLVLCQTTVIYWLCCRGLKACVGAGRSQQGEGDRIRTRCILASQSLSTHQVKCVKEKHF